MKTPDLSPHVPLPASTGNSPDEVDPELLALPDPPRTERTITLLVLVVTALASMAMVLVLARDAAYAFASHGATDLGELRTSSPGAVGENKLVRGQGMLGAVGAIRYERPFESSSYRVAPVAGRPDVWVEMRVPAGEETARFVPPSSFTGRLVRFDSAGPRHRGLAAAIRDAGSPQAAPALATSEPVPAGAWLIVDGDAPDDARWAVALVLLFFGFAGWNAGVLIRLIKKVR
jgi:hypothetical protein